MVEIIKGLYVGSDADVPIAMNKGCNICSCCKEGAFGHRALLGYTGRGAPLGKDYYFVERDRPVAHLALNLIDSDDPNFIPEQPIAAALKFIAQHHGSGERILVHCNQGHSRSPSIALMYLRQMGELPDGFHKGYKLFKALYDRYDPGMGMRHYVKTHYSGLRKD